MKIGWNGEIGQSEMYMLVVTRFRDGQSEAPIRY